MGTNEETAYERQDGRWEAAAAVDHEGTKAEAAILQLKGSQPRPKSRAPGFDAARRMQARSRGTSTLAPGPDFPLEVFPGKLQTFVTQAADALRVPGDMAAVFVLGASAAAIGASRLIQLKPSWHEGAQLWMVVVGRPGDGKSPALKDIFAPIYDRQKEHSASYEQEREEHEAGRRTDKPKLQRLVVSDVTVEKLASIMGENTRGLVLIRDELSGWVRSMNQYRGGKGADRQFYLSSWSAHPVIVDRMKHGDDPVNVDRPVLTVCGGLQPDVLSEFEEGGRDDGFVDRLLFCCPAPVRQLWSDRDVDEKARTGYEGLIQRLLSLDMPDTKPRTLHLTAAAALEWRELHDQLVTSMEDQAFPPRLRGAYAKLRSYAARFALVLQCVRAASGEAEPSQVDEDSIVGGFALADYFGDHAKVAHGALSVDREDRLASQAIAWLERRENRTATLRDLMNRNVAGVKSRSDASYLVDLLEDRNLVEVERKPMTGGERITITLKGGEEEGDRGDD